MITPQQLIEIGFKSERAEGLEILGTSHSFIIVTNHGKTKEISIASVGTFNEMVYIKEWTEGKSLEMDMVVFSNYDYDGHITLQRIQALQFAMKPDVELDIMTKLSIANSYKLVAECVIVLQELVTLKDIKDSNGKDPFYETNQPLAWERARKALSDIDTMTSRDY